jgi:hypothetical protein
MSFASTSNSSGSSTLPCGTPDITLSSSGNCPPILTLCLWPKMNCLIHTSSLEATIFRSSWSIIIVPIRPPVSSECSVQCPDEPWLLDFCMNILAWIHVDPRITNHFLIADFHQVQYYLSEYNSYVKLMLRKLTGCETNCGIFCKTCNSFHLGV